MSEIHAPGNWLVFFFVKTSTMIKAPNSLNKSTAAQEQQKQLDLFMFNSKIPRLVA